MISEKLIQRHLERLPHRSAGYKQLIRELGLHGAERHTLGEHVAGVTFERWSAQPQAHAVRVFAYVPRLAAECGGIGGCGYMDGVAGWWGACSWQGARSWQAKAPAPLKHIASFQRPAFQSAEAGQ